MSSLPGLSCHPPTHQCHPKLSSWAQVTQAHIPISWRKVEKHLHVFIYKNLDIFCPFDTGLQTVSAGDHVSLGAGGQLAPEGPRLLKLKQLLANVLASWHCHNHHHHDHHVIFTLIALLTWAWSTSYSTTLKPSLAKIMAQLLPMSPEPTIPIFSFLFWAMSDRRDVSFTARGVQITLLWHVGSCCFLDLWSYKF